MNAVTRVLLLLLPIAAVVLLHVSCTTVWYHDAARGTSLMETGRYQETLVEYTRAINLMPDYSTAYLGRGYVYQRLGYYQNALADYTKVIGLAPNDSEVYVMRGLVHDLMGRPELAIRDYSMAIAIKPSNTKAYYYRGMGWQKLGNSLASISDLKIASALGHRLSEQIVNHGSVSNVRLGYGSYSSPNCDFSILIFCANARRGPSDWSNPRVRQSLYFRPLLSWSNDTDNISWFPVLSG